MSEERNSTRNAIAARLAACAAADLAGAATQLLNALGYRSPRTLRLQPATAAAFRAQFDPENRLDPAKALAGDWRSVQMLFQLTDEDIQNSNQLSLAFDSSTQVDNAFIQSYLFFAIDLAGESYTRTQLATASREINRLFPMPVLLLFRHAGRLSFAVIDRRLRKRDSSRDVLEKVTLIKDIDCASPHRAHIEILHDLSLAELQRQQTVSNFVELHRAWRTVLSSSELNRRFFAEIANWYFWAVQNVTFPNPHPRPLSQEERGVQNAVSVIRLITRLIFVWFLKEKGLIPNDLFNQRRLAELLHSLTSGESSYYKAILQNLFFATLNVPQDKRRFRSEHRFQGKNPDYANDDIFRYQSMFREKVEFENLFLNIPFLNGGLFECLDRKKQGFLVDGFSDDPRNQPKVPDYLFFDLGHDEDLNDVFATRNKRYPVRGLLRIFDSYKFTIEENTPIEEEIALDPELLGQVFENLLAAYNPETGASARKQTGSFYTPRPIVEYMVDESLLAYLETALTLGPSPWTGEGGAEDEARRENLRGLLAYTVEPHGFSDAEVARLIAAIDRLKVLDPACGSGAFPMGVLHKLVFLLGKLDPENTRWRELQRQKAIRETEAAYRIGERGERQARLLDIEETFDRNSSDYGRKLYLIENCIYGVDIQPIAVQIAKLRFFISLVVDQKLDDARPNRGIRPLPNLETKFVAANTLIGIPRPPQLAFRNPEIERKERDLAEVRRRHFAARNQTDKEKYRAGDKRLRGELADLLRQDGWGEQTAGQLAAWDPYDQNAHADFFDPEWMFGLTEGFDITIGNPPYVRADASEAHLAFRRRLEASGQYKTLWEKWDLYIPFIEMGYKLLKPGGITTMIVSDAYCHSKYAQKSQSWFLQNSRILRLDFLSRLRVFDAAVRNIIYFFQKADGSDNEPERRVHDPEFGAVNVLTTNAQSRLTYRAFFPEDSATNEFKVPTIPLNEICYISVGMVVHADEKIAQGAFELKDLVSNFRDSIHSKPFVEGKHLDKWIPITHRWLEWDTDRAPGLFRRPTFPEIYDADVKLLASRMSGQSVKVCFDSNNLLCNHTTIVFVPWISLRDVRNRSLKMVSRYKDEKPVRSDLPNRQVLEGISQRFSIKYVLAVMNSSFSSRFLQSVRRSNTDLYPDDWRTLSIPDIPLEQQQPVVKLVDQILAAKAADPAADVSALEAAIDGHVYRLYNLTPAEIALIGGKSAIL